MKIAGMKSTTNRITRRRFLGAAAAAAAAPLIIPDRVLGLAGQVAPSNRITIGCIGLGGMGNGNLDSFLGQNDTMVLAVCDVDSNHLRGAAEKVNRHNRNNDCKAYKDFRELVARDDIDAISLATPDHWHAIPAVAALKSGKDVYGEKPLAHSIREQQAIVDACRKYGRVWQTGSWQRSVSNFREAVELVLNGYIGRITHVEVGLPTGGPGGSEQFTDPPEGFDYDFWVGPAPWAPYSKDRTHWNWRWQLDYGGGQLLDWIGHHCDIAHWGMGADYTGPVEVEATGEFPKEGLWNAPIHYTVTCKYANGVIYTIADSGSGKVRSGTKWIGTDGWVWVDRGGFDASNKAWLREGNAPKKINLLRSPGHHRNFLDCVKSRRTTLTPAEVAHRSATPGHLGMIAMQLGRKIRWNPDTEEIINDPVASSMLGRAMREPWQLG